MAKPQKYTDAQIINAASTHLTMQQAADSIGMRLSNFALRAKKLDVYVSNQTRVGIQRNPNERKRATIPLDEILNGLHPQYGTDPLRKRLIKDGIKLNQCEICQLSGHETSLQLDHINGLNNDHTLVNLRILCPHCHSQTATFGGKNKKLSKPFQKDGDILIVDLILEERSTRSILQQLNMVDYGINYKRVDRLRRIVDHIRSR